EHPDFAAALTEAEKLNRQLESARIFARANGVLASDGLFPAAQLSAQGNPSEIIRRIAARIGVELIVVSTSARVNAGEATLLARPYKTAGRKQKMYQI
ncbi:MAG TPA: hypothetical protein VER98_06005, partial [Terriglobia bacterium]|nr:hypothetical protein [Terriglobia bacterium]